MTFVETSKLKNFVKHQIGCRNNQGHAESGDACHNFLVVCPPIKF